MVWGGLVEQQPISRVFDVRKREIAEDGLEFFAAFFRREGRMKQQGVAKQPTVAQKSSCSLEAEFFEARGATKQKVFERIEENSGLCGV